MRAKEGRARGRNDGLEREYNKMHELNALYGKENADLTSAQLAQLAAQLLEDRKGRDVRVLDLRSLTPVTDYFVIATANNPIQARAMADYVEEKLGELGVDRHHVEGYQSGRWILLDYGSVVIHVFNPEEREFYNLERLWGDAPEVERQGMAASH